MQGYLQSGRLSSTSHISHCPVPSFKRLRTSYGKQSTHRVRATAAAAAPPGSSTVDKPLVSEVLREDPIMKQKKELQQMMDREYKDGWRTIIESETFAKGLTEDVVRAISAKKEEPEWLLNFRLKAFKRWLTMYEPRWSDNTYPDFDYQDISYYSAPKKKAEIGSLDEVDPAMRDTWARLNIPIQEQKRLANVKPVARDLVFDSVSIATTFKKELAEHGVIFMSISEAVHEYPDLVKKHLGSVVSDWQAMAMQQCWHSSICCPACHDVTALNRHSSAHRALVTIRHSKEEKFNTLCLVCRFPQQTTTLLLSTQRYSLMAPLCTSQRVSIAPWSCPLTSESMLRRLVRYSNMTSCINLV